MRGGVVNICNGWWGVRVGMMYGVDVKVFSYKKLFLSTAYIFGENSQACALFFSFYTGDYG
jgi:hypothetical protein